MSQVKDTKPDKEEEEPLFPVVNVDGVPIPKLFETNRPIPEHIERLRSLEMRDDDILIMAYAKTGTHWLWEITTMLIKGKAQYDKRAKENFMMEARTIESIQAEESPRILNSHLLFRFLPRQIVQENKVKVVHVHRNVKDVFVSMFYHCQQIPGCQDLTWDRFEKVFLSEKIPTGNYFNYLREFQDQMNKTPDMPVFLTSYEDLMEDPEKVIESLAQFLKVEASPELIKEIATATAFTNLKEADKSKIHSQLPPANYYRKGQVGDWKNHMTMAQSERFDAAIEQQTSRNFRFRFRYTL
ncbi:hypothetical protein ACOMHN_056730 [Nucella lapillus]